MSTTAAVCWGGVLPPVPALIPIANLCPADSATAAAAATVVVERSQRRERQQEAADVLACRARIDAVHVSRDGDAGSPQAPARRMVRPERHRKSDRRRRSHHDVDSRQLRKRSTSCSTTSSTCSTASGSARRNKHRRHRRYRTHSDPRADDDDDDDKNEKSLLSLSSSPPLGPRTAIRQARVNPIFLWVKQEDTRIVEVRCEDYDKRNRIRLTKTAHGWRAIPRTETTALLAATVTDRGSSTTAESAATAVAKSSKQHKPKSRRASKSSKRKTILALDEEAMGGGDNDAVRPGDEPPVEALTVTREDPSSPSWSAPVNIESHLPSHTITVLPRKKMQLTDEETTAARGNETSDGGSVNSGVVAECSAPPRDPDCCGASAVPVGDVSPLDNLLAVAEFEFNHQVQAEQQQQQQQQQQEEEHVISQEQQDEEEEEEQHEHHVTDDDIVVPPTPTPPPSPSDECCDQSEIPPDIEINEDIAPPEDESVDVRNELMPEDEIIADDLLDTTSEKNYCDEQHKEILENIVQLNKLIESRERSNETERATSLLQENNNEIERVPSASNEQRQTEECDYNDDDENNLSMEDIITRLEQSLQSPEACAEVDELCAEATNYIALQHASPTNDEVDDKLHPQDECIENFAASNEECIEIETDEDLKPQVSCPQDLHDMDLSEDLCTSNMPENESEDLEPTDLSSIKNGTKSIEVVDETNNISDEEQPTDLSTKTKQENAVDDEIEEDDEEEEDETCIQNSEDDLPTDLSVPKRTNPTPPPSVEMPRPASHSSETIQSPQPSGIPAVPPSPDIFSSSSQKSKSLFLESLLSSSSPKLCLTPEVTITRQQKEPLDLGKSRKSASPTVTCSEEAKSTPKFAANDGEPPPKRIKMEDITLKNLLHAESKANSEIKGLKSSRTSVEKADTQKVESSRLLELLTTESDPDPVTQLKQILGDPELNIPDPLLVPKDRLSQILVSPAREIPRLLALRPELRLPEALAFPQLLQDPDILVISLAQLQTILQKQSETMKLQQETSKITEKVSPKPSQPQRKVPEEKNIPTANDFMNMKYSNFPGIHPSLLLDAQMKQMQNPHLKDLRGANGLAGEIDAATTAAFNQMLWLPYLNQLEAAAMACGNNSEFLKALNAVFPPTLPTPEPNMCNRFGMLNSFPTLPPSVDYSNQLEMAMWQEAMLKASNMATVQQQQHRPKNPMESLAMKSAYRDNAMAASMEARSSQSAKKHHSLAQRVHSSARTSPIAHNFQQHQRGSSNTSGSSNNNNNALSNPFLSSIPSAYQIPSTTTKSSNLQIPQYNPNLAQWNRLQQQHSSSSSSSRLHSSSKQTNSVPNNNYQNQYTNSKSDYLKYQQSISNLYNQQRYNTSSSSSQQKSTKPHHHHSHHQQQQQQSSSSSSSSTRQPEQSQQPQNSSQPSNSNQQQRPRLNVKSLQNLLSPSRLSQEASYKRSMSNESTTGSKPIDLSGSIVRHHDLFAGAKLKVKQQQQLVDSSRMPKLLKHHDIEIPEVGSTTSGIEDMTSAAQLTDAQTQLWHPLFGKYDQIGLEIPWPPHRTVRNNLSRTLEHVISR